MKRLQAGSVWLLKDPPALYMERRSSEVFPAFVEKCVYLTAHAHRTEHGTLPTTPWRKLVEGGRVPVSFLGAGYSPRFYDTT